MSVFLIFSTTRPCRAIASREGGWLLPFANSCSQMRTTDHPFRRNTRSTNRSRARFAASFARQNALPVRRLNAVIPSRVRRVPSADEGSSKDLAVSFIPLFRSHRPGGECRGHPCQKQPSTNTATCCLGKMKSGRIVIRDP